MENRTRVAVVDDHELVAMAVAGLIADERELEFTRHAPSVAKLIGPRCDADVVILDLSLRDGTTPAENVRALQTWGAEVLVLTSAENPYLVREASRTGALGIVRKSAPREVIVGAIRAAARGEHVPSTEWASALDTDPMLRAAPLTAREREVLGHYASGMGAREVAAVLFVSENTVNDHLRRIRAVYHQLGRPAGTKVELYQRGVEDGFVPSPVRD
ncbi:response regulator transcription factor [Microbacterium caowuchunii]|uniref:Response regulator transcription factor n=1 Tax=Microbacterium caowuchunii TaxID=2614638 RepID=A0A5N0TEL5_9MICO|nr:response regulator transcription factor [Microbacterium caowuchunii]KAA9132306.1 response regulator transcription factor [Microbacterium caowuchunii]